MFRSPLGDSWTKLNVNRPWPLRRAMDAISAVHSGLFSAWMDPKPQTGEPWTQSIQDGLGFRL